MIGERLKELREERNLLQKDIAKYLNITSSAYGYYEQGKRSLDIGTINKLADFFYVSADYLLGRTENRNSRVESTLELEADNPNRESYIKLEEKIKESLLVEGIVSEDNPVSKDMLEKVFKYGIDAAMEIIKLEKELGK